jgi:hypothetical protein
VVWRLGRLGRSLKHLIAAVSQLQKRGIGFRSITENIDTTTSDGKLVFHVFGALAEFEQDIIQERTKAGLAAARADMDIGASEDSAFWTSFLRRLVERGLHGVELAISDAHLGLQDAIRTVLTGATWQRCRVHTMRNILAQVPQRDKSMVVAAIRTIFAQPTQADAKRQLAEVVTTLRGRWDKAADVLEAAVDDVLAYMSFPSAHWSRIDSTNPLERLNREVKRRTEVVGVFPDTEAVLRLVGSVLIEIDDEWQVERRYFSQESMQRRKQPDSCGRSLMATPRLEPVR